MIYTGPIPLESVVWFHLLTKLPWSLSIAAGVVALVIIKYKKPFLKERILAIAGIFISVASIFLPLAVAHSLNKSIYAPKEQMGICSNNMVHLMQTLKTYAEEHDDQFTSNWCDVLITEMNVSSEKFICSISLAKSGQSSYAINKSVVGMKLSDIPPGVVLLFESIDGWNNVGGIELLTTACHQIASMQMCNIVFANGTVRAYQANEVDKLRWNP